MAAARKYRPMRRGEVLVFAGAALLFLLAAFAMALLRLRAIAWWLGSCAPGAEGACAAADWYIRAWWLLFVPLGLALAWGAHHLTRARLEPPAGASG